MSAADNFLDAKPGQTAPASPADSFLDAKPGGEVVPFSSQEPDHGEIRATTFSEKVAMGWEKYTGGLFSSGPKSAPLHEEGVKAEWGDLPHMVGGMAVEQLLNPGNLLLGATGVPLASRLPAISKAVGNAFATGMLGKAVYDIPSIYREWKNPDVSGAQATADTAGEVGQAILGKTALNLSRTSMLSGAPAEALHSLASAVHGMGDKPAGQLIASLHGATPLEAAQLLKKIAGVAPPEVAEHLNNASKAFQTMHDAQPPEVKNATNAARAWDDVKRIFAPASRGPLAEVTAGILREHGADLAQRHDRVQAVLKDASGALMKLPEADRWEAVDDIENGRTTKNPELQGFADTVRSIMDTKRAEIQALGTGKLDHFIEDYFPHIWKDPEKATDAFRANRGKAPLEGTKSFLKERTIPTIKEGIDLGLEPASNNPVDLVLAKAREMDKYITGQKVMQEMKDRNMVQFVRSGDLPPEGHREIDDRIATVYGPRTGAVKIDPNVDAGEAKPEDVTVFGQRIMGKYYAPPEVADVMNNYLSPGLRGSTAFRGYLTLANSINQFQLGFSAFHLGFTTMDVATSKLALALEQGAEGVRTGNAKMVGKAAVKAASIPFSPITNMFEGSRGISEWMRPGTQGHDIAQIMDMYRQGGGRAKMDEFYQTSMWSQMKNMLTAAGDASRAGETGKAISSAASAAWRAPFAAIEKMGEPLMNYVVPRQKVGIAMDMLRHEMEKMPKDASVDDVRKAAGKVIDSVDNRMGQMVYDNLFWNKVVKDIAMSSVRSVGWNLGTIRELGGGAVDTAKFINNALTPGQKAEFTHRMAYAMALPAVTMMMGATYTYLKTGEAPETLKDYFAPKTGEKDPQGRDVRMMFPTYAKDVFHYEHDPIGTLTGKVHPAITMGLDMLKNEDFFGRSIRNSDDPLVQQLTDTAKYAVKGFEPMSFKNYGTSAAANQTTSEKAGAFVGVTRAPAWMGETDAEQLAGKLAGDKFKSTASPDSERVAQLQSAKEAFRNGDDDKANSILDGMEDAGTLTSTQRKNLQKGTDHTYLENAISHLDAKEVMRVYKQATPKERESIADTVQTKIDKAHIPDTDKQDLQDQFDKLSANQRDIDTSLR